MALVEKVCAVIVLRVGSVLVLENQIGVFVGLGLGGLDFVGGRRKVARRWNRRAVIGEAVKAGQRRRIFERVGALRGDHLGKFRRENVGRWNAYNFRIG